MRRQMKVPVVRLSAKTRSIIKRFEKIKERIAKQRDVLRDVHSEMEEVLEGCDQTIRELESAIDKLSEYL